MSEFKWKYSLGMTIGHTRHNAYRDHDKKVQKESHGKHTSYWIDGDPKEYKNEEELSEALKNRP